MTRSGAATADLALAARDHRLPGLEVVLDAARLAELLRAALPGLDLLAADPGYVRYKPGTSCLVACTLRFADRDCDAYALLHRPDERGKLNKYAMRAREAGELGLGAVLLPDIAAGLYPFPHDRRIPALPALADPARRREILQRAIPGHPGLWDADLTVMRRKPERRLVARLDGPAGGRAVLKAFAADFPMANRAAKLGGSGSAPRTPRRLGRSRKWNVVVSEWLPGEPLPSRLDRDPAAASAAGAALAMLHRRRAAGMRVAPVSEESRRLLASARMLSWLLPELANDAAALAGELAVRLPSHGRRVVSHGDFSADQVLLDGDRASLIDLDEAVVTDAGRDLGSFRAALARDAVSGELDDEVARAAGDALLEGYAGAGGRVDFGEVDAWTAAAMLHLAVEPFRRRDPRWAEQANELLEVARAL